MSNCGQACPYNTLDGCKVKEHNAICPLTNMATPIKEYRMTNADRIRAMSDELLASQMAAVVEETIKALTELDVPAEVLNEVRSQLLEQLKQPAEECQ